MKLFSLLALLTLIYSPLSFGKECRINSYKKILYIPGNKTSTRSKIIKDTNCSDRVVKAFTDYVFYSNGTLTERVLNRDAFIKRSKISVHLSPKKIRVVNLKDKLKDYFELGRKWSFGDLKFVNRSVAIGLNKNDSFDINCDLCHTTGKKNISINIFNSLSNYSKTYWLNGNVYISTKILVLNRSLSPSESQMIPSDFTLKSVNVIRPESYFTNLEKLVFYKANKPLTEGSGLKFSDISPVTLVSAGMLTKVILKNRSITVHGKGIPNQSGKLGEIIIIRNPKTNKVFSAKVIDYNKVMVDL